MLTSDKNPSIDSGQATASMANRIVAVQVSDPPAIAVRRTGTIAGDSSTIARNIIVRVTNQVVKKQNPQYAKSDRVNLVNVGVSSSGYQIRRIFLPLRVVRTVMGIKRTAFISNKGSRGL